MASKLVGMITEKFVSKGIRYPASEYLPESLSSWCSIFLKRSSPHSNSINTLSNFPTSSYPWEIRKTHSKIMAWLQEWNSYALFFDGASKGNLGVVGAGGILLDPRGKTEKTFAWGLGHKTNNEAEWMALLQGLELLDTIDSSKRAIFGNSRQVIYKMINGYTTGSIKCRRLYDRITTLPLDNYEFYHIL